MAPPPDRVLDDHYDKWLMACVDNVFKWLLLFVVWQELIWLHLRSHEVSSNKMPYDERYTEYIEKTRLLPFFPPCVMFDTTYESLCHHDTCSSVEAGDT
jgi:hypothetical protein